MAKRTNGKSFGTVFEAQSMIMCSYQTNKFCYLRGLIEGPGKATIAGFSLATDNYNTAVELLGRRFGKKVAIERAHVSQLLNVHCIQHEGRPWS